MLCCRRPRQVGFFCWILYIDCCPVNNVLPFGASSANCVCGQGVISEFTQQDGKTLECDKRDGAITCMLSRNSLNMDVFLFLYKKISLKECDVWRKVFPNKIIVTLVTQGLPSSFLSRPVA